MRLFYRSGNSGNSKVSPKSRGAFFTRGGSPQRLLVCKHRRCAETKGIAELFPYSVNKIVDSLVLFVFCAPKNGDVKFPTVDFGVYRTKILYEGQFGWR